MSSTPTPLVSVVLAARDAERYLRLAIESVLRQSLGDLELLVVDDASSDATPQILAGFDDPRLTMIRRDESTGLASALNLGLERARGELVARMDADDVSLPRRLELQVARFRAEPRLGFLGSSILDLDDQDAIGRAHVLPTGLAVTRWRALFGTPIFHPTAMVRRSVLGEHGLGYDESFDEGGGTTQDYDLWSRLLSVTEGDNLEQPLVLYRTHAGAVSRQRAEHQLETRRRIALAAITAVADELTPAEVDLAWRLGDAQSLAAGDLAAAVNAFRRLLDAFLAGHLRGEHAEDVAAVRSLAARALARAAARAKLEGGGALKSAFTLGPAFSARAAARRLTWSSIHREAVAEAKPWLRSLEAPPAGARPIRVAVVVPEPSPYRGPIFDRLAERPELELKVLYSAETIVDRAWTVELAHPHEILRGVSVPGVRQIFRHDYPITTAIVGSLTRFDPDVVVVNGWSTFACQAAIVWSRRKRVPYVLMVDIHDESERAPWRKAIHGAVVPPIVRHAAGGLVAGTLSRAAMVARGLPPERIGLFANTIDVAEWSARAAEITAQRPELRARLGLEPEDIAVLSVARLAPEKRLDLLVEAVAEADDPRLCVLVAGSGPERAALETLAAARRVRLNLLGDVPHDDLPELYGAADLFALLSDHEPWGVVVNEAAACGLPLLLSDRVGAAPDLLEDGVNGTLVAHGDATAAANALRRWADPEGRRHAGQRSHEIIQAWGYGPTVESFVTLVREVVGADDFRRMDRRDERRERASS